MSETFTYDSLLGSVASSSSILKEVIRMVVSSGLGIVIGIADKDDARAYVDISLGDGIKIQVHSKKVSSADSETHLSDVQALLAYCDLKKGEFSINSRLSKTLAEESKAH